MDFDRYAQIDSPVHSWEIRLKILSLLFLTGTAVYLRTWKSLLLLAAVSLLLVLLAYLPAGFIFRTLRVPALFLILMLPVLFLTSGGNVCFRLGPVPVYSQGLELGGKIALRALSIILIGTALFCTARLYLTLNGFERLHMPSGLTQLFLFTYRYIFLYTDELTRLRRAVRLRGMSRARLCMRFRAMAGFAVNLLVHALEHSERVAAAMRLRGFSGEFRCSDTGPVTYRDWLKSAAVICMSALLIAMEMI